jgi:hypothetical protein
MSIRYFETTTVSPPAPVAFDTTTSCLAKMIDWELWATNANLPAGRLARAVFSHTPVPKIDSLFDLYEIRSQVEPDFLRHPILWMGEELIQKKSETDEELVYRIVTTATVNGWLFDGQWLDALYAAEIDVDTQEGVDSIRLWQKGESELLDGFALVRCDEQLDEDFPSIERARDEQRLTDAEFLLARFNTATGWPDIARVLVLATWGILSPEEMVDEQTSIREQFQAGDEDGAWRRLRTLLEENACLAAETVEKYEAGL